MRKASLIPVLLVAASISCLAAGLLPRVGSGSHVMTDSELAAATGGTTYQCCSTFSGANCGAAPNGAACAGYPTCNDNVDGQECNINVTSGPSGNDTCGSTKTPPGGCNMATGWCVQYDAGNCASGGTGCTCGAAAKGKTTGSRQTCDGQPGSQGC